MAAVPGIILALALLVLWALVTNARRNKSAVSSAGGSHAREALIHFADQSLELQSVPEILSFAREAAQVIFGIDRFVAFVPGAEEGAWEASVPGDAPLPEPPSGTRGLFAWFKHNPAIAAEADLIDARFGAMRRPLEQVMQQYGVDVIMPLVDRGQLHAVLGLQLGRRPAMVDRDLMRLFRLQATAACANVRLHREAAHAVSLAEEASLAGAVQLALVPERVDGQHAGLTWRGEVEVSGAAGSDFWAVYPLGDRGLIMLIGDAVGAGLSGSMVSAVVKSCADVVFDEGPSKLDPARLLGALNRALYRSTSPIHASCFAVLFDRATGQVHYANAGHDIPYHLRLGDGTRRLGVLAGAGPLLGDGVDGRYQVRSAPLSSGDVFVLYTDGLVKARGVDGEGFGERRLQKLLAAQADGDPAAIRAAVLAAVRAHRSGAPLQDDAALVVVRA